MSIYNRKEVSCERGHHENPHLLRKSRILTNLSSPNHPLFGWFSFNKSQEKNAMDKDILISLAKQQPKPMN